MADVHKDQAQAPPEENPILLAKKRAAERIKARFHSKGKHPMNFEKAHQWYQKEKTQEKQGFSKEEQLAILRQRLIYIAPRPTILKLLQEQKAA